MLEGSRLLYLLHTWGFWAKQVASKPAKTRKTFILILMLVSQDVHSSFSRQLQRQWFVWEQAGFLINTDAAAQVRNPASGFGRQPLASYPTSWIKRKALKSSYFRALCLNGFSIWANIQCRCCTTVYFYSRAKGEKCCLCALKVAGWKSRTGFFLDKLERKRGRGRNFELEHCHMTELCNRHLYNRIGPLM